MTVKPTMFHHGLLMGMLILVFFIGSGVTPLWAQENDEPSLLYKANEKISAILFFDLAFGSIQVDEVDRDGSPILDEFGQPIKRVVTIPLLIVTLILGAIFFTFWYRWMNVRGFKHAIDVIRGRYDRPEDTGEISHFRALTSALSATVGLGNIAGVAVAIQLGGPGAAVVRYPRFTGR